MKNLVCTITGIVGAAFASAFGGWSGFLTTLLICMAIDYATGMIVAGVFHNSPKSETGALESNAGLKGIFRKGMMLLFVLVGHRFDLAIGTTYIRDAVCIAFIVNEVLSMTENAGLMGVPVPEVITNAIDALKKKQENK